MKHTPGPWEAWVKDGWHVSDGTDRIADLAEFDDQCFGYDGAIELEEANARLIAAAPELLEACIAVRAFDNNGPSWHQAMRKIDLAIAKATGEDAT